MKHTAFNFGNSFSRITSLSYVIALRFMPCEQAIAQKLVVPYFVEFVLSKILTVLTLSSLHTNTDTLQTV